MKYTGFFFFKKKIWDQIWLQIVARKDGVDLYFTCTNPNLAPNFPG
jgi:hypothetical protein